jgi:hypothetical protein
MLGMQCTLFHKLRIELRLKIWRFSLFPRTIVFDFGTWIERTLRNRSQNPVTLQINQESRSETLRIYKIVFESLTKSPAYFHPRLDTFSVYPFMGPR